MYGLNTAAKQSEFWAQHEAESKAKEKEISDYLKTI